jgi:hypothetical protein
MKLRGDLTMKPKLNGRTKMSLEELFGFWKEVRAANDD